MNVLVFAPHPDDEIIGCGGSIISLARGGHRVTAVYLTSGEGGSLDRAGAELAQLREEEARRGGRILGVGEVIFLRNPDGLLACSPENITAITKIIRETRPGLIYLPHQDESHPDHRVTCKLVVEAARRAAGPWFPGDGRTPWGGSSLLAYEVLSPLCEVSYVEDVSPVIDVKIEALKEHHSQLGRIRYDEAVRGALPICGVTTGRGEYCECFRVVSLSRGFFSLSGASGPGAGSDE